MIEVEVLLLISILILIGIGIGIGVWIGGVIFGHLRCHHHLRIASSKFSLRPRPPPAPAEFRSFCKFGSSPPRRLILHSALPP